MSTGLSHRKATREDLHQIVELLFEDDLGKTREKLSSDLNPHYFEAFQKIDQDPNQYLMVVILGDEIVGTCHLTLMPSLTFQGATRMQIEAVRVATAHRGKGIGAWMMKEAETYGTSNGASILQLSTNKQRPRAKVFYESLGFNPSHEGMKRYLK